MANEVCKHCGKPIASDGFGYYHATIPYRYKCYNYPQPDPQLYAEPKEATNALPR